MEWKREREEEEYLSIPSVFFSCECWCVSDGDIGDVKHLYERRASIGLLSWLDPFRRCFVLGICIPLCAYLLIEKLSRRWCTSVISTFSSCWIPPSIDWSIYLHVCVLALPLFCVVFAGEVLTSRRHWEKWTSKFFVISASFLLHKLTIMFLSFFFSIKNKNNVLPYRSNLSCCAAFLYLYIPQ